MPDDYCARCDHAQFMHTQLGCAVCPVAEPCPRFEQRAPAALRRLTAGLAAMNRRLRRE